MFARRWDGGGSVIGYITHILKTIGSSNCFIGMSVGVNIYLTNISEQNFLCTLNQKKQNAGVLIS